MAEKGAKTESGSTQKRTVFKLQPVSYRITLLYLGDKRIKRDAAPVGAAPLPVVDVPPPYRCKYELRRRSGASDTADAVLDPLHIIPNAFRPAPSNDQNGNNQNDADPAELAATPGEPPSADPIPGDIVYKVMVTDNHGTRTSENLDLLGASGDNASNIKYYRDRGWIPDIVPAVPFRVVVRKFVGDAEVDLDKPLKIAVEIKDPPEELEQNDGRRRGFLEEFFKEHNRTKGDPVPGDDNAPMWSKGHRAPDSASPGIKATAVLRKAAYKDKPAADKGPAEADVLDFGADISAADAFRERLAAFEVKEVEQDGVKVGVADFAFVPWPVSGDNYRFLVTLVDGDKDIRETKENGADVVLKDDQDRPLPKPRAYTTGRFVLWRKAEFTMAVLAGGCTENDVDWDSIARTYRKLFMEVVRPVHFLQLTRPAWKFHIKQMFPAVPNINDEANYTDQIFQTELFPPAVAAHFATDPGLPRRSVVSFARRSIAKGCMDAGLPNPDSAPAKEKQTDGNGLFLFLCRTTQTGSLAGAYFGDRMFWFRRPQDDPVPEATVICAHEFSHLKSIRHSYTSGARINFVAGATTSTFVIDALANCQLLDHDGLDAFNCLQSYTLTFDSEPCAMCALGLRFWDRVEIQKQARYRQKLLDLHGPVIPARIRTLVGGGTDMVPVTAPLNLGINKVYYLVAVGPERTYTGWGVANRKGRINLSFAPRGENNYWTADNPCVELVPRIDNVDIPCIMIKGKSAGTATVTYRSGKSPTASVIVTVS